MQFRALVKNQLILETMLSSYHEAGHVVLMLLAGLQTHSCYINLKRASVRVDGGVDCGGTVLRTKAQTYALAKGYAAGLVAEQEFFRKATGTSLPQRFLASSEEDLESIDEVLALMKNPESVDFVLDKTRNAVNRHWDVIAKLAHKLYEHKSLSYVEIKSILTKNSILWKYVFLKVEILNALEKTLEAYDV